MFFLGAKNTLLIQRVTKHLTCMVSQFLWWLLLCIGDATWEKQPDLTPGSQCAPQGTQRSHPSTQLGKGLLLLEWGFKPDSGSLLYLLKRSGCQSTGKAVKQGLEPALKICHGLTQGLRGSLATLLIYPLIFSEKLPTTLPMLKKATEEKKSVLKHSSFISH